MLFKKEKSMKSILLSILILFSIQSHAAFTVETVEQDARNRGRTFIASSLDLVLASAADFEMLIQIGAKEARMKFAASATGSAIAYLFEGTTVSSAGTSVPSYNGKRSSSRASTVTFTHTPTITGDGTEIGFALIPGDSKKGEFGGSAGGGSGVTLKANTIYLLRLNNTSGGNVTAGLFTEHSE